MSHLICFLFPINSLFLFFVSFWNGLSGLKISVKVQSLSFQAGVVGKCSAFDTEALSSGSHALCYVILFDLLRISDSEPFFLLSFCLEPFYGTICLYNRERREKLSEDFHFRVLPSEMQDVSVRPIQRLFFKMSPCLFMLARRVNVSLRNFNFF